MQLTTLLVINAFVLVLGIDNLSCLVAISEVNKELREVKWHRRNAVSAGVCARVHACTHIYTANCQLLGIEPGECRCKPVFMGQCSPIAQFTAPARNRSILIFQTRTSTSIFKHLIPNDKQNSKSKVKIHNLPLNRL